MLMSRSMPSLCRRLVTMLALLTTTAMLTACGGGNEDGGRYVIVSGGQSGVYYPTAGSIASLARRANPDLRLDVQSTGGSVANVGEMSRGAHFGLMQNDIAAYALEGGEMFADVGAIDSLRGVAALYPEHIQIVARADAGIESVQDLAGKRVAIGDIGSGTEANARQILAAHGLSVDDLGTVQHLGAQESADYLQDNNADAAFFTFGLGTSAIQSLAAGAEIVFVPVAGEPRDQLMEQYPFYSEAMIPADTYGQGVPAAAVPTVSVTATLVARDDVPAAAVESVLRGIFDNLEDFQRTHRRLREVNRADAEADLSVPMHDGARAFYGESGEGEATPAQASTQPTSVSP